MNYFLIGTCIRVMLVGNPNPTHIKSIDCDQLGDSFLVEDLPLFCEFVKSGQCPFFEICEVQRLHREVSVVRVIRISHDCWYDKSW